MSGYTWEMRLFLWMLSGAMLGIAFIWPLLWWLILPAISIFIYVLDNGCSKFEIALGATLVGVLKYAGATVWIWNTYPLAWLGLEPGISQLLLIGAYQLGITLSLSAGLVTGAVFLYYLKNRYGSKSLYLLPIVWVIAEILGSFVFSIYSLGSGSYLNVYFGFGYVGYLISHINFLQPVAILSGVYGLSFVVVVTSLIVYYLLSCSVSRSRLAKLGLGIGCIIFALHLLAPKADTEPLGIRVITIDTQFSRSFNEQANSMQKKVASLTPGVVAAVLEKPDFVLLPEDSRFSTKFESPAQALRYLLLLSTTSNSIVVDSTRYKDDNGQTVLRAMYYDLGEQKVYAADKQYLVPQGEYIPYLVKLLLTKIGYHEFLSVLERNQSYRPGNLNDWSQVPSGTPAVLFCFEAASPLGVKKLLSMHHNRVVFHVSSHAWFDIPHSLWHQLDDMLVTQALWNNVSIVQAGNMVSGKVYRADGTIETGNVIKTSDTWRLIEYRL